MTGSAGSADNRTTGVCRCGLEVELFIILSNCLVVAIILEFVVWQSGYSLQITTSVVLPMRRELCHGEIKRGLNATKVSLSVRSWEVKVL